MKISIRNLFDYFYRPTYKKIKLNPNSDRVTVIQTSHRIVGTFHSEADADTTITELQQEFEEHKK